MKPINIFTEPYEITDIVKCSINKTVNEHFQASITGYIHQDEEEESYFNNMLKTTFVIKASTEDTEDVTLFRGTIRDIRIQREAGMTRISVHAQSKTSMLDMEQHTRTYQGDGQTYREIADHVLSLHDHTAIIQPRGKGARARGLVVQYEETDWQFLKRLASQLNTVLVPDCTNDHICFYFGNPEKRGEDSLNLEDYQIRRYLDLRRGESVEYILESRKIKNLCEVTYIKEYPFYVYRMEGHMINQELVFTYTLRPLSGFEIPEMINKSATGISITGEVTDVRDTRVRIKLFSELDHSFGNPIWFPFSTVYSSPDGTGWYCMPEKKDRIRLYIPLNKEEEAYVISAVHLEDEQEMRKNPDEKCIRTKYNKEIRLTPDKILLTNHEGSSITLDDKKGIIIKSNRKIDIISENEIEIKGEQVQVEGESGVILMEGPNMLMVRDGIKEQGINIEHR